MRLRKLLAISNKQQAERLRVEMNYLELFKAFRIETPEAQRLARMIVNKATPYDQGREKSINADGCIGECLYSPPGAERQAICTRSAGCLHPHTSNPKHPIGSRDDA